MFPGVHVWTADTQTAEDRAVWVKCLDAMAAHQPVVVVPATWTPALLSTLPPSPNTKAYLLAFEEELANTTKSDELIAAMTKRYPNSGMNIELQIGAKVAKSENGMGLMMNSDPTLAKTRRVRRLQRCAAPTGRLWNRGLTRPRLPGTAPPAANPETPAPRGEIASSCGE